VARTSSFRIALLTLGALLLLAPAAYAAKGGGAVSGGSSSLSVVMVNDANSNGSPNWNDTITFNVSTTATDKPWVQLNCYQSGSWVYTQNAGFFATYAWPPNYTLSSGGWTSGAGDCTATLYMVTSNGRQRNLATLNFHVDA
jgi:hypothetical protein